MRSLLGHDRNSGGNTPAHQGILRLPFRSRIHLDKETCLSRFQNRDRHTVAVKDPVGRK